MRNSLISMVLAAAVMATASAAAAQTSSGSFTVRLSIPALGAAEQAQRAGAVGGWTVFNQGGGFMVRTPERDVSGGLTILNGDRNRFTLRAGGAVLAPVAMRDANGLTEQTFMLREITGPRRQAVLVSAL